MQPIVGLPIRPQRNEMHVAGEPIEERRLGSGRQQALRLPLPVMLDEAGAQLGERRRGRELTSDPRGRSPVPGDRPRQDHRAVFCPVPRFVGRVETRLHPGGARVVADERGRATLSEREQQADGHHRLPGARFAGQHVETRPQLELEVGDHAEPTDVELSQHGADASAAP